MHKPMRVGVLGLALIVGMPTALAPTQASAQQQQSSLQLHRFKYHIDENGQVWLTVQFANKGHKAIRVVGVSPNRVGPYTPVGQIVEPDALVKGSIRLIKDGPSVVWVNCSEGLIRFALPARP